MFEYSKLSIWLVCLYIYIYILQIWDGVKVLVVSHCWLRPEHPDPLGERARQIANFVKLTQRSFLGYVS
jgi:hypothetical protein